MKELELSEPVMQWLRDKGYVSYVEVPMYKRDRIIDIVACRDSELIIVELKKSLTKNLVFQAQDCQAFTSKVYCAIRTKPQRSNFELLEQKGIGLLSVKNGIIKVLLNPVEQKKAEHIKNSEFLKSVILDRLKPGGVAGIQNQSGRGTARLVSDAVEKYIAENPNTTWKEIYINVPNHYANAGSMQSAMGNWFGITLPRRRKNETKRKKENSYNGKTD